MNLASGLPLQHEAVPISLNIAPGARYFRVLSDGNLAGPYEMIGEGHHCHTYQPLVVIRSLRTGAILVLGSKDLASNFKEAAM